MAADRACEECGEMFTPKRSDARFDKDSCRRRAGRKRGPSADIADVKADAPIVTLDGENRTADSKLVEETERALSLAGQLDSVLGQIAMTLARDLALSRYGAGAHASLAKELRAVMAEIAPAAPAAEGSRLGAVRGQGASRRTNPAGLHIVS